MLVKILSFGCNWWSRFGRDRGDRLRYTKHAAFYNSAGIRCGNKVRRHWVIPGLLRFNGSGDFNPHFPNRALGRIFSCTEPTFAYGGNRIVLNKAVSGCSTAACYLIALTNERLGAFDFGSATWRSDGVHPIAATQLRDKQEALVLMRVGDWVSSEIGRWRLIHSRQLSVGATLQLAED